MYLEFGFVCAIYAIWFTRSLTLFYFVSFFFFWISTYLTFKNVPCLRWRWYTLHCTHSDIIQLSFSLYVRIGQCGHACGHIGGVHLLPNTKYSKIMDENGMAAIMIIAKLIWANRFWRRTLMNCIGRYWRVPRIFSTRRRRAGRLPDQINCVRLRP